MEEMRPNGPSPRAPGQPRVLSFGQERLWYLDRLLPGPVYNVAFASDLKGNLDVGAFTRALTLIVERHEVLRTVILSVHGRPRPVLLNKWSLPFDLIDLREIADAEQAEHCRQYLLRQASHPFDMARDVFFRCALIRLSNDEYIFVHCAPHLSFEGSSIGVLYRELSAIYSAFVENRPSPLLPLPLQYADFAVWQRQLLTGDTLEAHAAYWHDKLQGAPLIELPCDFPRPDKPSNRGTRLFFSIPEHLISHANSFFKQCGYSRYTGFLSIFYLLLYAHSGMADISIGSPFRPRCAGIECLIGFFVNTVVLRTVFQEAASFREVLANVQKTVREAISHSDLTFDKVVETVKPIRDSSRGPLFQINFRAPKEPYPTLVLPRMQATRVRYLDNGTAKFDLALEIDASLGEACYFEYSSDIFDARTILKLISDFQLLITALIANPDAPLKDGDLPNIQLCLRG